MTHLSRLQAQLLSLLSDGRELTPLELDRASGRALGRRRVLSALESLIDLHLVQDRFDSQRHETPRRVFGLTSLGTTAI